MSTFYDAAGRVRKTIAYATAVTGTTLAPPAASTADRITRFEYDGAGNLLLRLDANNAVTRFGIQP